MCLTCVFGLPYVSYLCIRFALCALPVHLVCDFCRVGDVFMLSLCVTSFSFFFNVCYASVYWRVVHALRCVVYVMCCVIVLCVVCYHLWYVCCFVFC